MDCIVYLFSSVPTAQSALTLDDIIQPFTPIYTLIEGATLMGGATMQGATSHKD